MLLLPPPKDTCPICAVKHKPEQPHNCQSLYYQYNFYGKRGRWPTWADAISHCASAVQEYWKQALQDRGAWTEPEDGQPIADPLAESINQPIGDIHSPSFGPEEES